MYKRIDLEEKGGASDSIAHWGGIFVHRIDFCEGIIDLIWSNVMVKRFYMLLTLEVVGSFTSWYKQKQ